MIVLLPHASGAALGESECLCRMAPLSHFAPQATSSKWVISVGDSAVQAKAADAPGRGQWSDGGEGAILRLTRTTAGAGFRRESGKLRQPCDLTGATGREKV